jgi:hypothetical protein
MQISIIEYNFTLSKAQSIKGHDMNSYNHKVLSNDNILDKLWSKNYTTILIETLAQLEF